MWDPAQAVEEVEWAAEAGLRGVNLPRVQPGILEYNHPDWEPFWAACEDHDMALTTHAMGAHGEPLTAHMLITVLNAVGAGARQALNYLLFGGVFDHHPGLKLVFTEQPGRWFVPTAEELDSLVVGFADFLQEPLPKRPSEYMLAHLFVGVAVLAPFEAADAVEQGYDTQVMWGSDYPHVEGSYQYPRYDGEPSLTKATLQDTFAAVPSARARLMLSENAARVYGFDLDRLQVVADRIGSLTYGELATAPEVDPGDPATRAQLPFYSFRRTGNYH
jgi:predicted TIM-barrel fold metal-dependent hydrolase